jgi:hypothetical protein
MTVNEYGKNKRKLIVWKLLPLFKTQQRFGDWILPRFQVGPSSYLLGQEIGTSSIDWAQLSKFHLKTETESNLRSVVFLNKKRALGNVEKHIVLVYY